MIRRSTLSGLALALTTLLLPATASATDGWARAAGILRAGPSTDYPRVTRVSRGDDLDVHGCLARASWCDVTVDGDRGWLPGSRIELVRDGHRERLFGDTAVFGLSILTFGRTDYWGEHYRGRPWVDDRRWNRDGDRVRPDRPMIDRPPRADVRPSDAPGLGPVGARPTDDTSDRRALHPARPTPTAAAPGEVVPQHRPSAPTRVEAPARRPAAPEPVARPTNPMAPIGAGDCAPPQTCR
jgi:uncharacterized protein YraI